MFQGLFCVITGALVSGAIADRARFGAWIVFVSVWTVLVYAPIAHWVFDFDRDGHAGGWLANRVGTIDFAGGMAVEICSGASALALAMVVGTRVGFGRDAMRPHNLTLVMLGAGLLWFGWYGFNAGSALGANHAAAVVFVTTTCAAAAGSVGWLLMERFRDGHATTLGAASGMVAGLVAITPSGGSVTPLGALVMGLSAGVICGLAVGLKYRWRYDDSLDVVGVHLVGGLVGTIGIGLIASATAPTGVDGLLYGGGFDSSASSSSAPPSCWSTRSSSPVPSPGSCTGSWASGSTRSTRSPGSTWSSTRRPPMTCTRPRDLGAVAGCRRPRLLLVRSPNRHHRTERLET